MLPDDWSRCHLREKIIISYYHIICAQVVHGNKQVGCLKNKKRGIKHYLTVILSGWGISCITHNYSRIQTENNL